MAAKRLLMIDDDPGIRQIVQISLRAIAKWEVYLAATGDEGIALAIAEQPDAILLDLMMPDKDGISTLQELKANPVTQNIPVILLTAKVQNSEPQPFDQLELAGVITKPFKAPDLVQQIRSLLQWNAEESV